VRTIDFTPAWYRARLEERRGSEGRSAALLIALVLVLTWTFDALQRTHAAERAQDRLQAALASPGAIVARLQALEAEEANQRKARRILKEIRGNVPLHEVLAELSHLQPEAVSLQMIRLTRRPNWTDRLSADAAAGAVLANRPEAAERDLLELTGFAATGGEVAAFVRALDASNLCSAVSLRYERPREIADQAVREFQVFCTMPPFE
jgi:Tfp pilus assembly protein PilN